MSRPSQFTLAYLLCEFVWIAAALACFTQIFVFPVWGQIGLYMLGMICLCAAMGGMFRQMATGFWCGVVIFGIMALLLASALVITGSPLP